LEYTWVVAAPAVGRVPGPQLKVAHTATRISSLVTDGTSVTFNLEEVATLGSTGPDLLAADQVALAGPTGASTTSFDNSALAADAEIVLDISDVTGTTGHLRVTLATTV